MTPWDEWWNRNFPPYSWRRLGFLLACVPPIAIGSLFVSEFTGKLEFSWTLVVATTAGMWLLLPLTYGYARSRAELDDLESSGWTGGTHPMRSKPKRPPRFDLLYSFAILFVGFMAVMISVDVGAAFDPLTVGMSAGFAAFVVLLFALRYSVLSVILLAAVGAVAPALMLYLFFLFLGGGSFFEYWVISFIAVFALVLPIWWRFRETRKIPALANIPLWILSAGATSMMVVTAGLGALAGEPSSERADAPVAFAAQPLPTYSIDPHFGASTKEAVSLQLFFAWKNANRAHGLTVAHEQAVDDLFAIPVDPGARFLGCGIGEGGFSQCAIRMTNELIVLSPNIYSNGNQYVRSVQRKPLDYALSFEPAG